MHGKKIVDEIKKANFLFAICQRRGERERKKENLNTVTRQKEEKNGTKNGVIFFKGFLFSTFFIHVTDG